ncbi:MAG: DegT/DnrJ/EryC1/StrS family aminotransferase [Rudaea sp.]
MSPLRSLLFEVPPTAGLPPRWADLWPSGQASLTERAAAFVGVEEIQVECSGTAALVVALTALRRRSKRTCVVVPAYTCPLVPIAIAHCGLKIRLCDLAPDHFDMHPAALAAACDEDTLAIVPTHLAGRVADVDTALACARRVGALVIEDAAQALGARCGSASVGLQGDIGFFSLAVGKGLTLYEGGLLVARDPDLRAELHRCHDDLVAASAGWEFKRSIQLLGYHVLYRPGVMRWAYGWPRRRALRAGNLTAAVGDDFPLSIPLHRVGAWRQGIGARAFSRLANFQVELATRALQRVARLARISGVRVLQDGESAQGTWPFLLLLMNDQTARDRALDRLWNTSLGVSRLFIHALPDYPCLASIVASAETPNARAFASRTLTISNSPGLDSGRFEQICRVLEEVTAGPN